MNRVPLGEVATVDRVAASDADCERLPYIGLEHIEKDAGHLVGGYSSRPEKLLATKFLFSARHVLYGKLRPYLNKVFKPDFDGVCTTEILPILPKEQYLDRGFLFAVLRSPEFVAWASHHVSGANLPRLAPETLLEYPLPLPGVPEQQRIANILEKADRLRRMRRYAIAVDSGLRSAAFAEMFGDLINNSRRWPKADLGDYLQSLTSGSRGWAAHYSSDGDIFLRIENVGRGGLLLNDVTRVKTPKSAEAERTRTKPGDVLLSITADLGRSAWIPEHFPDAYINQHLALLRPKNINPVFLAALLSSDAALQAWGALDRAAVKSGLNFDDIRRFKIITPPLTLQEKFAKLVAAHAALSDIQREGLRQADHLFQSMTRTLFLASK